MDVRFLQCIVYGLSSTGKTAISICVVFHLSLHVIVVAVLYVLGIIGLVASIIVVVEIV